MADTLLVVSPDATIDTYNQGGLSLIDFDRDEIIGKPLSRLIAEKKYTSWVRNLPAEMISSLEPEVVQNQETILLTRKEGEIPVLVSASPIYDAVGKLHGAVFVARDLRERKKLEDHFNQIKSMESIANLAGGVAHDFNNLLTVILGNIDLVQGDIAPGDPHYRPLNAAATAGSQAAALTEKFLFLSRGGYPHKKLITVKKFITDTVTAKLCGPLVKCECRIMEDLWPVEIDAGQIGQVIAVVIDNAKDAMEEGGTILITVKNFEAAAERGIREFALADKKYVEISINDSGRGMVQKDLSRVFDPYFTTKETYSHKGLGLGLTVAYSIMKKHAGYIEIESEPAVGTTVHLYLPAAEKTVYGEQLAVQKAH